MNSSKSYRICAIIVFSVIGILLTTAILLSYLFGQQKPSAPGIVIVFLYDTFAIWFDIHYIPRKKDKIESKYTELDIETEKNERQRMRFYKNKTVKVVILSVLVFISIIFTAVPILAYFVYSNTPSIFAIFVVICYDVFTAWFVIHNFRNKKS